jgi:hypothetical protein
MIEVCLDELEQACNSFYDKLKKFKDYIEHLETVPENKMTARERELVKKFGKKGLTQKVN